MNATSGRLVFATKAPLLCVVCRRPITDENCFGERDVGLWHSDCPEPVAVTRELER